jgi:hypothetical protein
MRPSLAAPVVMGMVAALGRVDAADVCPATSEAALNLVWDRLDANGLPLGPRWCYQETRKPASPSAVYPVPDPSQLCGGFPTNGNPSGVPGGRPTCVDKALVSADTPHGIHSFICGLEWFNDGRTHVTRGHINWLPVTYEGFLSFLDKSGDVGDNDYNFELETLVPEGTGGAAVPRQSALTVYNRTNGTHRTLHVEMKGRETVSHATHPWWVAFREAVEGAQANLAKARSLIAARPAVVIGLFGLDAEHKGHSELHPVYAMAIQTSCGETADADGYYADRWAVFVRNAGNEGFCSTWTDQHHLDLPEDVVTLRLPTPGLDAATLMHTEQLSANVAGVVGPAFTAVADAALVSLKWAPVAAVGPVRVHGMIDLKWKSATGGKRVCARSTAPAGLPEAGNVTTGNGPDELVERIYSAAEADTQHELLGLFRKSPPTDSKLDSLQLSAGTPTPPPLSGKGICPGDPRPDAECSPTLRASVIDRIAKPTGGEAFEAIASDEEKEAAAICRAALAARAKKTMVGKELEQLNALISYCQAQ